MPLESTAQGTSRRPTRHREAYSLSLRERILALRNQHFTPKKADIKARATELFMKDQARAEILGETLPEENELKESGFWQQATNELMSSQSEDEYTQELDKTLRDLGRLDKLEAQSKKDEAAIKQLNQEKTALESKIRALEETKIILEEPEPESEAPPPQPQPEPEQPKQPEPKQKPKHREKDEPEEPEPKSLKTETPHITHQREAPEMPEPTPKINTTKTVRKTGSLLESVNKDMLHIMDSILHLLESTISAGKLNPAQALLGMKLIADILHGGAYTQSISLRPFNMENPKLSPYYANSRVPLKYMYPVQGSTESANPIEWFLRLFDSASTIAGAQLVVAEIYANADVPHVFPKLISDETFADINVLIAYLAQTELVKNKALGVKTFVEGETALIRAVTEPMTAAMQQVGQTVRSKAAGKNIAAILGKQTEQEPEEE